MLYRFFTSVRLTITLLLGLAVVSIAGTILPVEANRFDVFYQAPWFRTLLFLLSLNLMACTWKTLRRNLDDPGRFSSLLQVQSQSTKRTPLTVTEEEVKTSLKSSGFRLRSVDGGVVATRGRLGRWGSTIVHISLLVILLGGILSEFGFVGTLTLPVGESNSNYFNWDDKVDLPLGFTVQLDNFEIIYYPIEVRIGFFDPLTRELLSEVVTREGELVPLPIANLSARVVRFIPFDQTMYLDILRNGEVIGTYQTPSNKGQGATENFLDSKLLIRPTGFRDPIDKQYQSKVSILEQGEVVRTGLIEVNQPLIHRGVAIYQTAYNQDEFGFWYSGFQLSKDPGEPLVWGGSILLIVGLCCAFSIRHRALAVIVADSGVSLQVLTGFGDERGERLLAQVSQQIEQSAQGV